MKRRAVVVSFVGALVCAPAFAADPAVEIVQEPGPSWSGFYVGGHLGVGMGNLGYTSVTPGDPPTVTDDNFADTFFAVGIHAGYDHQFAERWVGGVEIEYTNFDSSYTPFPPNPAIFWANWEASLSGRVGYLVTPHTLFYGRLGVSTMDVEGEEGLSDIASGNVTSALIGAGAETFVYGNWTARLEAAYLLPGSDFEIENDGEFFDPKTLILKAGFSYRLGAQAGSSLMTAPAPEISWNGFYAGAYGAFGHGSLETTVDSAFTSLGDFGSDSPGLGAFAGYDFRFGDTVAGVELEGSWLDFDFHDPRNDAFVTDPPSLVATVQASFMASARIGRVVSPGTLLYAKAGFGALLVDANEEFFPLGGGGSETLAAYQIGAGIESALTDNVTMRLEGLYTEATDHITADNTQSGQVEIKPSLITARIGLAYRF